VAALFELRAGARPYRLREGRYRCRACRYTFGDFTGTWLGQSRVRFVTWLWLLKLFELEVTAHQAAIQTGVSYPTALRVYTTLRRAVLAEEEPGAAPGRVGSRRVVLRGPSARHPRPGRPRQDPGLRHLGAPGPGDGDRGAGRHAADALGADGARGQTGRAGLHRQVCGLRHAHLLRLSASAGRPWPALQSGQIGRYRADNPLGSVGEAMQRTVCAMSLGR